jgi:hypothetical protein
MNEVYLLFCTGVKVDLSQQGKNILRVYENRVLRRMFRPKREEFAGGWRRLHHEQLHNVYASQNITRVRKSRRM